MTKRILSIVFTGVFIFLLLTGGILLFAGKKVKVSTVENRFLAEFPAASLIVKDSFPTEFDRWQVDHFPFRNDFLNVHSGFNLYLMKQSPIPDNALIGKDMWLYYTAREIDVYRGTNRLNPQELGGILQELKKREQFITEQGAKMLVVVSPIKYSVYPEFVPARVNRVHDTSRTDQFVNLLGSNGIQVLDLRKELINAKRPDFPLFFKTDNHWNYNGAFTAYQAILKKIRTLIPNVSPPLRLSDYKITRKPGLMGNIGKMLFLDEAYSDIDYIYERKNPGLTRIDTNERYTPPTTFGYPESYEDRYTNGDSKAPKILIIRDSFGYYPAQFLKEHFSSTVLIFDAWEFKLNPDIIRQEKPDIVLFMSLESFLHQFIPAS